MNCYICHLLGIPAVEAEAVILNTVSGNLLSVCEKDAILYLKAGTGTLKELL